MACLVPSRTGSGWRSLLEFSSAGIVEPEAGAGRVPVEPAGRPYEVQNQPPGGEERAELAQSGEKARCSRSWVAVLQQLSEKNQRPRTWVAELPQLSRRRIIREHEGQNLLH